MGKSSSSQGSSAGIQIECNWEGWAENEQMLVSGRLGCCLGMAGLGGFSGMPTQYKKVGEGAGKLGKQLYACPWVVWGILNYWVVTEQLGPGAGQGPTMLESKLG